MMVSGDPLKDSLRITHFTLAQIVICRTRNQSQDESITSANHQGTGAVQI